MTDFNEPNREGNMKDFNELIIRTLGCEENGHYGYLANHLLLLIHLIETKPKVEEKIISTLRLLLRFLSFDLGCLPPKVVNDNTLEAYSEYDVRESEDFRISVDILSKARKDMDAQSVTSCFLRTILCHYVVYLQHTFDVQPGKEWQFDRLVSILEVESFAESTMIMFNQRMKIKSAARIGKITEKIIVIPKITYDTS